MKEFFLEFWYFFQKNLRATIFGSALLFFILITHFVKIPFLSNYDFIFLMAILIQIFLLATKIESFKEFKIIFLFHIVATIMEIFKTHPDIASWNYPQLKDAYFVIMTVPLFTGFLYSAVGSYISRAWDLLELKFLNYPKKIYTFFLALIIYLNFFTHHFFYDFRYLIFLVILVLFWKTKIEFLVYKKQRKIHFLIAGFLTAVFIWLAENIGTYSKIWLYPNQADGFKIVSFEKIGSWFLLLIISFVLVSLVKMKEKKY